MADFVLQDEVFYHGTRAEFDIFRPLSHFGSKDAAQSIVDSNKKVKSENLDGMAKIITEQKNKWIDKLFGSNNDENQEAKNYKIIPVKLNITKTYELQDIAKCHDLDSYTQTMLYHIKNDLKTDKIPQFFHDIFTQPLTMEHDDVLRELAQEKLYKPENISTDRFHLALQRMIKYFEYLGYDGFHYINEYEDPGHISYIPFRPEQIIRLDKKIIVPKSNKTKQDVPAFAPLHEISRDHKQMQRLECIHYDEVNSRKPRRIKFDTPYEHKNKTIVHYAKFFTETVLPEVLKLSDGLNAVQIKQDVLFSLDCAITCACDPLPVILACALRNIGKSKHTPSSKHGARAAIIAKKFIREHFPKMHDGDIEQIINAIRHHSDGTTSDEIVSACAWDGARISQSWNEIYRPEYFSTSRGNNIASMPPMARQAYIEHLNKSLANIVPETKIR